MTNNNKAVTVKDRIIEFMRTNPTVKTQDIVDGVGISRIHASVILAQLVKENKIERIKTGVYSLEGETTVLTNLLTEKKSNSTELIEDLDMATLLRLKSKFGRATLIKKLKDSIKLLE